MSVILNSGVFGQNGRGSIVLDKANGVRQVITPIGDTKLVVAGSSVRGSVVMTNSVIAPGPIGTSFGSYGFIGGPSFPPPAPSITYANQSISRPMPVTVPGVPIVRTSMVGGPIPGGRFPTVAPTPVLTFTPPVSGGVVTTNILTSTHGGMPTTTTADQAMLASVQRSAYGGRITTTTPAYDSNSFPALQPTFIDADPITPGIQSQPGIVEITGPTTIVGRNSFVGTTVIQTANTVNPVSLANPIIDADPITPGIQTQPGVITQIGPSVIVGKVPNRCCGGITSWLLPLLGLLLLAALLSGLYYYFKSKDTHKEQVTKSMTYSYECGNGFMLDGRCITCPTGSKWDGKSCTYQSPSVVQPQPSKPSTVEAIQDSTSNGNNLPESTVVNTVTTQSKTQKIDVFDNQNLKRNSLSIPQQEGVKPQLVSTKPLPSKPSVVVDSKEGSDVASSSEYTSTNLVTVAPIIEKRSVPVKYTYFTRPIRTRRSKTVTDMAYDTE